MKLKARIINSFTKYQELADELLKIGITVRLDDLGKYISPGSPKYNNPKALEVRAGIDKILTKKEMDSGQMVSSETA